MPTDNWYYVFIGVAIVLTVVSFFITVKFDKKNTYGPFVACATLICCIFSYLGIMINKQITDAEKSTSKSPEQIQEEISKIKKKSSTLGVISIVAFIFVFVFFIAMLINP
jgi:hypothetical protein